jgi:hypothetical protein
MSGKRFTSNRKFPTPVTVTDDPRTHTLALQQVIEALAIGQRRTREIGSSYVRLEELVDVGLIEIVNGQLKLTNTGSAIAAGATALADLTDVDLTGIADGDMLVYDLASSTWVVTAPGSGSAGTQSGVIVTRTTTTAFTTGGTEYAISFDTEVADDEGYWDAGTPTRITIPVTGWYTLVGTMNGEAIASTLFVRFRKNGTAYAQWDHYQRAYGSTTVALFVNATAVEYLTAGDYIELVGSASTSNFDVAGARLSVTRFAGVGATGATGPAATQGRHSIYVSAGAMLPSALGGCQPLSNIASAASQPDIMSLNFDATTQEYAQFSIRMPKSWDEGTLTFVPVWSHAATTTNFGVVWDLQAVAISNDDTIAVAYGTAVTSTDTGGTTNDLYIGPESSAMTVAGTPQAEDVVHFRISRVTGNGSDTMAIDARLHGVTIYLYTDADNDA